MPGPDLLARYLNVYLHARQMCSLERPWGLGEDGLDELWARLAGTLVHDDPRRLNSAIARELSEPERARIAETLAPLIFALPLRSYPAELRGARAGPWLVFRLRHTNPRAASLDGEQAPQPCLALPSSAAPPRKTGEKNGAEHVGHLPAALTPALARYLRRVLRCPDNRRSCSAVVSSGGRRRRVRVTLLANDRGVVIKFLERLPSPLD